MVTHSCVLAWRTSGMREPCGLPSMGSHRVRHDWSYLAAAAAFNRTFQVALVVKNPPTNAGDLRDKRLLSGSGRSPAEGNGNLLQYSCLVNSMDRGAWWATVHRVTQNQTWLKQLSTAQNERENQPHPWWGAGLKPGAWVWMNALTAHMDTQDMENTWICKCSWGSKLEWGNHGLGKHGSGFHDALKHSSSSHCPVRHCWEVSSSSICRPNEPCCKECSILRAKAQRGK